MTTIIVSYAAERFGHHEHEANKNPFAKNCRAMKMRQLRKELKTLKKQFKLAKKQEQQPGKGKRGKSSWPSTELNGVGDGEGKGPGNGHYLSKTPSALPRSFLATNGHLKCSLEEVTYLHKALSDSVSEQELGPNKGLVSPDPPSFEFNQKEPSWKEIEEVIKAARSASAPGPSGVPYSMYTHCPRILHHLWKILKVFWRKGRVADHWRCTEGVWIPKEENSKVIRQFRTI